ncbi:PH-domain-containing protein [Myriangium duriaei CBS 260.36]|uniref:PH-domain-containing protein n=1 Tax=Myriangium duriaei CBS 260.36 TaxID=1168546 RepID=A0A9P4MHV2_9PEZI|nr:PH-domain-containing protein [Myriangium duriaei CBS 260.36]
MTDILASPQAVSTGSPTFTTHGPAMSAPNTTSPDLTGRLRDAQLGLDTLSPVNQKGHFEFDRVIKAGPASKRTRKTKSWKSVYLVLRPNFLSIYRNPDETKLRHKIVLSELTAVARQKDPKGKAKHVFGLFSPSRNYHLAVKDDTEAQEWVEFVRQEARMDEEEEDLNLASPGGNADTHYFGFNRAINHATQTSTTDTIGMSSSEAELPPLSPIRSGPAMPWSDPRRPSTGMDYSGAENASYSDFSDAAGHAQRMSVISTSRPAQPPSVQMKSQDTQTDPRNLEEMEARASVAEMQEAARIVYQNWVLLLKTRSGVKAWKKTWMVLRARSLALYKDEKEYSALKVFPFDTIVDAVEINPISSSKRFCLQVITDEKGYRFCARDEDDLAQWLGAFKSLLVKRREMKSGTV